MMVGEMVSYILGSLPAIILVIITIFCVFMIGLINRDY